MSTETNPPPKMFVSRDFDHTVIGNFMKKKYAALCQLIGKPEATYFYYSKTDIDALFAKIEAIAGAEGISFYFATYVETGDGNVDAIVNTPGYENTLTLVMCAFSRTTKPTCYYLISPLPGGGLHEISLPVGQKLIAAYVDNKLPLLEAIIKDAGIPTFKETKLLYYDIAKWEGPGGWLGEADAQSADGITVFLGSYAKDYTIKVGTADVPVGWQMTAIFELTKSVGYNGKTYLYDVDLEDTPSFPSRVAADGGPVPGLFARPHVEKGNKHHWHLLKKGGDTAAPCPPSCCPPDC